MNTYIGRARVVDFLDHHVAHDIVQELTRKRILVTHHITDEQSTYSCVPSCGYNSAMVAAKMAARQSNWMNINLSDCCDKTPQNSTSEPHNTMLELGDIHLGYPPPHNGRYLSSSELSRLFEFYSELFYAERYNQEQRRRFVEWAFDRATFLRHMRAHITARQSKGEGCPLHICILNTMATSPGSHWITVAYEMTPVTMAIEHET